MPVDPDVQNLLNLLVMMNRPPMSAGDAQTARDAFRMLTVTLRQPQHVIAVGEVTDITIPGPAGDIAARVYRPSQPPGQTSTIAFFHGGGFVIGDIDTHDNQARRLCRDVGAVVISIDYRRAPENPWPAGVDDAGAATRWIADNIDAFGADPTKLAVAGDSAGGNFAAIVAQVCRDAGGPRLAAQLLIYPTVDFSQNPRKYPSRQEFADGYFLTTDDMIWFSGHYLTDTTNVTNPHISPILGDLAGLPPAVVVTAEFDPLRDEGEAYAQALAEADVPVTAIRFDGLIHGFFDLAALSPACARASDRTCEALAQVLAETRD
ncbi:MAG: alpha/beta hydrolase [Actinomycetes bacterium]